MPVRLDRSARRTLRDEDVHVPTVNTVEDPQLKALEQRLALKFSDSVTPQDLHEHVQRAYDSFSGAHIRSYIPVLVTKMVTGELRTAGR
jgi:hypothetical protein